VRKTILLRVGDRNEFEIDFQTPSIDELSFMPKYMEDDEECVVQ